MNHFFCFWNRLLWIKAVGIIFFILILSGCKKDEAISPFVDFVGTWKPTSFKDIVGMHNAPPVSEKPGVTYTMSGNKLYYSNAELHGTDSLYVTVTRDTFDMTYSVTTSLKNKSTLVISESYAAIDKSANVVKLFNFNKEVQLEEGKSSYGVSPKNMIIKPDKIAIFYYDWSSYTFWIEERVLEKIK